MSDNENFNRFDVGGAENYVVGPTLSASATLFPTHGVHHVTNASTIGSIALPWAKFQGAIVLIPDSAFSLTSASNIGTNYSASANIPCTLVFDGVSWFPK